MWNDQGSWNGEWKLQKGWENDREDWNCEQQIVLMLLKQRLHVSGYPEYRQED